MKLADEFARLGEVAVAEAFLGVEEVLDHRFELGVLLIVGDDRGAADDERCAGLVNEDRVHFIDDGEIVAALDLVFFALGHAVVAQVVETEFGVGAVGDVAVVLFAADGGRLVVQNAADGQPQELVNGAHPFAVTGGQVIVDGDQVDAAAGEGVQINRQRGDQGLAFTGRHFGNMGGVQRVAADELDVEGDHFPPDGVVAHDDVGAAKAPAGVFDHREGLGQNLVQPAGQGRVVGDLRQFVLPGRGLLAQDILRLLLKLRLEVVDLLDQRLQPFDLALVSRADEFLYDETNHVFEKCPTRQGPCRSV